MPKQFYVSYSLLLCTLHFYAIQVEETVSHEEDNTEHLALGEPSPTSEHSIQVAEDPEVLPQNESVSTVAVGGAVGGQTDGTIGGAVGGQADGAIGGVVGGPSYVFENIYAQATNGDSLPSVASGKLLHTSQKNFYAIDQK